MALANWADVAGKVRLFLDKLAQLQAAGMVPPALYNQWSATGVEVWGGLRAAPGPNSVNPATLPAPSVSPPPPAPTEPPLTYTLWPLPGGMLPPGQYTAFVVPSLPADERVPSSCMHWRCRTGRSCWSGKSRSR